MIAPRARIQRIAREPLIHQEYLESDEDTPTWTVDKAKALIFDRYLDADTRAKQMGGRPIFAVTIRESMTEEAIAEPPPDLRRKLSKPRHRFAGSYANA